MTLFESNSFFGLYKKYLNRKIFKIDNKNAGVIKKKFPSLLEVAPSGTWTSLNKNKEQSINLLETNIKIYDRIIFTDIDNILGKSLLKAKKNLKNYHCETWYEADIIFKNKSFDDIYNNFKRRVKRNIKKVTNYKNVNFFQNNSLVNEFYKLHKKHSLAKGYAPYPIEFIIELLKIGGKLFFVTYNEKIIGSHIMLFDEKIAFQYIHALDESIYKLRIDDFFRYKLIEYAYNQKKDVMKFGGTPQNLNSLLNYKLGFGSIQKEYHIYTFYHSFFIKILYKIKDLKKK